jgi:hypothetical protein
MSTTDTQAMGLLIRMLPLVQREFSLRVDPTTFFGDSGYRDAILDSALNSSEPRLQTYASQLRQRLIDIGKGPAGALRSSPTPREFQSTSPTSPLGPPIVRSGAPAPGDPPAATPAPSPPPVPARKYVGRLR